MTCVSLSLDNFMKVLSLYYTDGTATECQRFHIRKGDFYRGDFDPIFTTSIVGKVSEIYPEDNIAKRTTLSLMNSFATGVRSEESPEIVQARREAYEQKKRETGANNLKKYQR